MPGRKFSGWQREINDAFVACGEKQNKTKPHSELHADCLILLWQFILDGYNKVIQKLTIQQEYLSYRQPLL